MSDGNEQHGKTTHTFVPIAVYGQAARSAERTTMAVLQKFIRLDPETE